MPLMVKLPTGRQGRSQDSLPQRPPGEQRCLFGEELAGSVGVADCGLVADAEYGGEMGRVGSG